MRSQISDLEYYAHVDIDMVSNEVNRIMNE